MDYTIKIHHILETLSNKLHYDQIIINPVRGKEFF